MLQFKLEIDNSTLSERTLHIKEIVIRIEMPQSFL